MNCFKMAVSLTRNKFVAIPYKEKPRGNLT